MTQLLFIPDSAIQNSNPENIIQNQNSSNIDSSKKEFWQIFEKLIGKSQGSSSFDRQINSEHFNFVGKNFLPVNEISSRRSSLTGLQSAEAVDYLLESPGSAVMNNNWSSIIKKLKTEIQIAISVNNSESTVLNTKNIELETDPKKPSSKLDSKVWLGVSLSKGLSENLEEILKQNSNPSLASENPGEEKIPIIQSFVLQHNDQPVSNSQNTQFNKDEIPYGNELLSLLDDGFESTPILNKTSGESSQVVALIRVSQKLNVESQTSTNNELILPTSESLLKTQLTANTSDSHNELRAIFHPSQLNEGIWLLFTDQSNSPNISGKNNSHTVSEGMGFGKISMDLDTTILPKIDEQYFTELSKQALENETLINNSDVQVNEEDGIQNIIRVLNAAVSGDNKDKNLEESLKLISTNQQTKSNQNTEKMSEFRNSEENEDIEPKDKIKGSNKFVFISNKTLDSLSNLARSENQSLSFTMTEEVKSKLSPAKPGLENDVKLPKVSLAQDQNTIQPTNKSMENNSIPNKEGWTPVVKFFNNSFETSNVSHEIGLLEKQLSSKDASGQFNQVSNPQKNAGNLERVTQTQEFVPEDIQETLNKPFNLLNNKDTEIFIYNKEKNKLSRNTNINKNSISQPTHSNQAKETLAHMNNFQELPGEKIDFKFQENLPKNISAVEKAGISGKDNQKVESAGIKIETAANSFTKVHQDKTTVSENKLYQPLLKNDVIQMNYQKMDQPDNSFKIQNNFDKPAIPLSNENIRDAVDQLVQSTKLYLTKDAQKISVQLKPEFLGMAKIVIESSEQEVKAILYVERPEVRNALERQIIQIHKSLQEQNIRVDKIEVMDFSSQFSKNSTNTTGQDERHMLETDRHLHDLSSKSAVVNPGTIDDFNKRDFGYNTIELTA